MSELWYWRSSDRIRGPLVTEELEAVVLSKRLQDRDAVRLEGTDEWLPAAEIRAMFEGSRESPAVTAAKLLESAAARRLKSGSTPRERSFRVGGALNGVLQLGGVLFTRVAEVAGRTARATAAWLGHRSRVALTVVAAIVALGFLGWRFIPWGESDLARLQRLKGVWKQMQARPAAATTSGPPDVMQWLVNTETDLALKLRERPIAGAKGTQRQRALARREMLFAAREIRRGPSFDEESRERIDESLESATNYLLEMPGASKPANPGNPAASGGHSTIIVAMLVVDIILVIAAVTWWAFGRWKR
ncbi:MAG TPA: hypothetical protein VM510_13930 [Caulifigura sp.]|jgi:hypothetical protein|nr:hypothetical protein [Caulifigura sp.]